MPFQRPLRSLSVLISVLAALVLAVAGCSHIAPLGPDLAPVNLPPPGDLRSPITMQVMHGQPPADTGQCPAGSIALFGTEPGVLRIAVAHMPAHPVQGSTATPAGPPAGVACYLPVGTPVTVTYAAVSPVTTYHHQPGPVSYGFVIAFSAADVVALTAVIRQAYHLGDALGMSVDGKLWQAPRPRHEATALWAEQINLSSRTQALQLYRLLVPPVSG